MFNLSKTKPVILPFKPSMSPQLRGPAVTLSLISETLALFLNLHFFHLNYNWSPNHINSTNVIPCSLSSRSDIAIATNHICDTTLKILRGSRALIRSSTVLCHRPQALFKPSLTSLISYPATLLCSTLYFCQNKCLWSPKCVMLTLFQGCNALTTSLLPVSSDLFLRMLHDSVQVFSPPKVFLGAPV